MSDAISTLFERYDVLSVCADDIRAAYALLENCFENSGKLLVCGNGGSAADCEHIVGELMKGFLLKRPLPQSEYTAFSAAGLGSIQRALPAISLVSHTALMTAFSNDVDSSLVFAQQVYGYSRGCPNDVLLGLSTSGNSANVVKALEAAKLLGVKTVAITGLSSGKAGKLADICICLPESETFKVQELTLPVYHALCAQLEAHFFG